MVPTDDSPRRSRWSLAIQLPLLTAFISVLVMALMLTLTYRALVQTRAEALHNRHAGILRILTQASVQSTKPRLAALRTAAADSAVQRALIKAASGARVRSDAQVVAALQKLTAPADSGMPVELWSTDGQRIAFLGDDVRGDSVATLAPELRSLKGTRVSEVPIGETGSDSIQYGSLYPNNGRVWFWVVAPVNANGKRVGYIAQQRRIAPNAAISNTLRDLSGEEVRLHFRNLNDDFTSSFDGRPLAPPVTRDTADDGFTVVRAGVEPQIGMEARVPNLPYIFSLETPLASIVAAPRATLRRIMLLGLLLLVGAVTASWLLSRRITRPLKEFTAAVEGIARGNFDRHVETAGAAPDEVVRLGESFNRMLSKVQASQTELASQVEEAQATSEELEQTNVQLQEASDAARQARDAALSANQAKSDFLAVMSHELRTPLNAIGGYADILQLGIYGEMNEAQQDALARIARSQQTLLSLINDILNYAKLEAGEVRYSIADVPLASVLQQLEAFIAPQLRAKALSYEVRPCGTDVCVRADPEKLQQVLINLLSNAIKYTQAEGRIELRCDVDDRHVRVHVSDTGIGIAADRLEHIFDPFIQVGRALNRPHEGVGLGLSISRDLASGMGGGLSVRSTLGEGSEFTLTLDRSA